MKKISQNKEEWEERHRIIKEPDHTRKSEFLVWLEHTIRRNFKGQKVSRNKTEIFEEEGL